MQDLPDSVAWLVARLLHRGFSQVADTQSESFGDRLLVFRRPPVEVRLIRDRSQWTVDLIADGWPERDRVPFPLFHGFALDPGDVTGP
jgi:hypothetical protein